MCWWDWVTLCPTTTYGLGHLYPKLTQCFLAHHEYGSDPQLESTVAALRTCDDDKLTWEHVTSNLIQEWPRLKGRTGTSEGENNNTRNLHCHWSGGNENIRAMKPRQASNSTLVCDFCEKEGHKADKCYRNPVSKSCKPPEKVQESICAMAATQKWSEGNPKWVHIAVKSHRRSNPLIWHTCLCSTLEPPRLFLNARWDAGWHTQKWFIWYSTTSSGPVWNKMSWKSNSPNWCLKLGGQWARSETKRDTNIRRTHMWQEQGSGVLSKSNHHSRYIWFLCEWIGHHLRGIPKFQNSIVRVWPNLEQGSRRASPKWYKPMALAFGTYQLKLL